MKPNQTRKVYCVLENGTHKLVDDKSLATKLSKKDAEHMLSSYGNATIEELNNSDFNRFIVVAQTESKGSYTI
jgi:cell division ATPase FtsA